MDKSTTPFGESEKRQSVTKKIFELAKASPTDFFINISPLFTLSKIKIIHWGSNNQNPSCFFRLSRYLFTPAAIPWAMRFWYEESKSLWRSFVLVM
jgi:hypothetical protein